MKNLYQLTLVCILAPIYLNAQLNSNTPWVEVEQPTNTEKVIDVAFSTSTQGAFLCANKQIMFSEDQGETFTVKPTSNFQLSDIVYTSENTLYGISGYTIRKSSNNGDTWDSLNMKATYALNVICNVGQDNLFAGGYYGIFYSSTDGGVTWNEKDVSVSNLTIKKMNFIDEQNGWYMSTGGDLFWITEGGDSYSRITIPNDIIDVKFFSLETGYIITIDKKLYKTTDGGQTWSEIDFEIQSNENELFSFSLLNENTIWIFASKNIYKSTDGGEEWQILLRPDIDVKKILFISENIGFGFDNPNYPNDYFLLCKTYYGGEYPFIKATVTDREIKCLEFLNNTTAIAIDDLNNYFISNDGGFTWSNFSPNGLDGVWPNQLVFANENIGFITEFSGTYKTTDGGQNWVEILDTVFKTAITKEDEFIWLRATSLNDSDKDYFYISYDNGNTWETKAFNPSYGSILGFTDNNTAWGLDINSEYYYLYKTIDLGTTATDVDSILKTEGAYYIINHIIYKFISDAGAFDTSLDGVNWERIDCIPLGNGLLYPKNTNLSSFIYRDGNDISISTDGAYNWVTYKVKVSTTDKVIYGNGHIWYAGSDGDLFYSNPKFITISNINPTSINKPSITSDNSNLNVIVKNETLHINGLDKLPTKFCIYNSMGQQIHTYIGEEADLSIGDLPTGVYILQIIFADNTINSIKFIK